MNFKKYGTVVSSIGILSLGLVSNVRPAEALALEGGVSFTPIPELGSGVVFEGTGFFGPDTGEPLTNIDFTNPSLGGSGQIVQLSAGTPPPDDFAPFIGWTGEITDLAFPEAICNVCIVDAPPAAIFPNFPNPGDTPPVEPFIVIDTQPDGSPGTGFTISLDSISEPIYEETIDPITGNFSTTVSLGVTSTATNLTDGAVSFGSGTLSADFAGLSANQVRASLDEPGEITLPNSYSSTFVFRADIPEPSSMIGLVAFGLASAGFLRGRKKQKQLG